MPRLPSLTSDGGYDVYRQRDRRFPAIRLVSVSYIVGDRAAVHAPVPRHLEHVPVDGLQSPALHAPAQDGSRKSFAIVIAIGNISIPVAVLAGVIQ